MAKIYSIPDELMKRVPTFNFKEPMSVTLEKEKVFVEEIRKLLVDANPDEEFVGEEIQFPAADGYARYMVATSKPVALVHLPLGDAWEFEYAHKMTKKDIAQKVEASKRMAELFAKKKEGQ